MNGFIITDCFPLFVNYLIVFINFHIFLLNCTNKYTIFNPGGFVARDRIKTKKIFQ